jgi:FdrA protein
MNSKADLPNETDQSPATDAPGLLSKPVKVINVGLERFASDLEKQGTEVVQVDWAPPARGNARLAALLSKLGG